MKNSTEEEDRGRSPTRYTDQIRKHTRVHKNGIRQGTMEKSHRGSLITTSRNGQKALSPIWVPFFNCTLLPDWVLLPKTVLYYSSGPYYLTVFPPLIVIFLSRSGTGSKTFKTILHLTSKEGLTSDHTPQMYPPGTTLL